MQKHLKYYNLKNPKHWFNFIVFVFCLFVCLVLFSNSVPPFACWEWTPVADSTDNIITTGSVTTMQTNADDSTIYWINDALPGVFYMQQSGGVWTNVALDLQTMAGTIAQPTGIAISPDFQTLFVSDATAAKIYTVPIATGTPAVLANIAATGLATGAFSIALSPDGSHLYYSQTAASSATACPIYSIKSSTPVGTPQLIFSGITMSSSKLYKPYISVSYDGAMVIASDTNDGIIWGIDTSGSQKHKNIFNVYPGHLFTTTPTVTSVAVMYPDWSHQWLLYVDSGSANVWYADILAPIVDLDVKKVFVGQRYAVNAIRPESEVYYTGIVLTVTATVGSFVIGGGSVVTTSPLNLYFSPSHQLYSTDTQSFLYLAPLTPTTETLTFSVFGVDDRFLPPVNRKFQIIPVGEFIDNIRTRTTTKFDLGNSFISPTSIVIEPISNVLYVTDNGASHTGLFSVQLVTGTFPAGTVKQINHAGNLINPVAVECDGYGNVYVLDRTLKALFQVTSNGLLIQMNEQYFTDPNDVAIDSVTMIAYVVDSGTHPFSITTGIYQVDLKTHQTTAWSVAEYYYNPISIARPIHSKGISVVLDATSVPTMNIHDDFANSAQGLDNVQMIYLTQATNVEVDKLGNTIWVTDSGVNGVYMIDIGQ